MKFISLKNKYFLFCFLGGVLLLGIIVAIVTLSLTAPQKKNDSSISAAQDVIVSKVLPDSSLDLKPGVVQVFKIYFKNPVSLNDLIFSISFFDITKNDPSTSQPVTAELIDHQTVNLKSIYPIRPWGKYTIVIKTRAAEQIIFQANYLSSGTSPTPVQSNNPSLAKYLPYETSTFKLSYLNSRNIYVFNFKYDPSVTGTVNMQFENAKTEALNFVKSKGIDPSSIVIDFRRK